MNKPYDTRLPPHLAALKLEIEGYAREYGLDFYETIFEVIDAEDLNEIAAYGGFPTRYPHWSFGMQFEELKKGYDYGLSKIYEMVINNDPCYAYLMRSNHVVDQKLVMAHVYGHCLAPETRILTEYGQKAIRDIRVGDMVLTHTGRYKAVRVVARRPHVGLIHRVRVRGAHEAALITGEHPVGILHKDGLRWIPASELGGGMYVGLPKAKARATAADGTRPGHWVVPGEEDHCHIEEDGFTWQALLAPTVERYDGIVHNFSVEEDESYTLAAGFVVHNCDFFKNNAYFGHTSRKMMDEIANHGARVRAYAEKHGEDEVEAFMDRCMSIDDLIDVHSVAIKRRDEVSRYDFNPQQDAQTHGTRFKSKDYMDQYINPPGVLKAEEDLRLKKLEESSKAFPESPQKDVLLFLIEHAPLKPWQRDVLSIVRDEAYYFAPQGMTKIANEGWACLTYDSLIFTQNGAIPLGELVERRLPTSVSDGSEPRRVYDWAKFPGRETVAIGTRRGLELAGSTNHRVLRPGGLFWTRLDELRVGDRIKIGRGTRMWAKDPVRLDWKPARRKTLQMVASEAGVDVETVIRLRESGEGRFADRLRCPVQEYEDGLREQGLSQRRHTPVRVPECVDERLATFLGYLTGDGHVSDVKRTIGLTSGDESQADHFLNVAAELFGVTPVKKWDKTKWRVRFSSRDVQDFLVHLGFKTGPCAREKTVPDCILRSPGPVVAAFLRALYDCDGYAGKAGVILSTSSTEMSKVVQLLLLNFGVLSRRIPDKDGCWHVHTQGKSAATYREHVGFELERKKASLDAYIENRKWFKEEDDTDEVVSIERGRADVYDVSVETTHRYAAQGFINHNSYWHSTIMTQKALSSSELIDYADHHSGTMAMSGGRLNPYKIGIELLRDIEMRWDTGRFGKEWEECEDVEKKRTWDLELGLGRKKIFEVRRIHNDITFIDTFLTPEFCVRHNLFTYAWQEQAGQYYIESRDFQKVKQRLLFSLTNFGKPWIYVVDGNYRNRGELLLQHQFNGVELKLDQAADTLANVQHLWGRPVHLSTLIDGKATTLTFDGTDHSIRTGGEADDPRKSPAAKPR